MDNLALIEHYFPDLTPAQHQRFEALGPFYEYWNARINLISRRDMEHFYERHVLHSLGIAQVEKLSPAATVLDVGTGGGFPGIPLAILYPHCHFHLVDSIQKKVRVVEEAVAALALENVTVAHQRAEKVKGPFSFVVSRAVTQMPRFLAWIRCVWSPEVRAGKMPGGLLALKGGDLSAELQGIPHELHDLSGYFKEPFFETKKVVYVPGAAPGKTA